MAHSNSTKKKFLYSLTKLQFRVYCTLYNKYRNLQYATKKMLAFILHEALRSHFLYIAIRIQKIICMCSSFIV